MAMTTKTTLLWIHFSMYLGQYGKFDPLISSHRVLQTPKITFTTIADFLTGPASLAEESRSIFKNPCSSDQLHVLVQRIALHRITVLSDLKVRNVNTPLPVGVSDSSRKHPAVSFFQVAALG